MGDRVAVLRDGVLQQCDTPRELFTRPGQRVRRRLHRLAGDEHDAPPRSPARWRRSARCRVAAHAGPARRSSRPTRSSSASGPRALRSAPTGGLDATVDLVEELGSECYLYCTAPGVRRSARSSPAPRVSARRAAATSVQPRARRSGALHVFDAGSGKRRPRADRGPCSTTRVDPVLGTVVHVVGARQARPNLPSAGCPFCVGGLEAPDRVRRALVPQPVAGDGRRTLRGRAVHADARRQLLVARSSPSARKVIDLWADRTAAARRARRRRVRARVREPWCRGRRDHRPSARADLRLRPRAQPAGAAPRRRLDAARMARRRHARRADDRREGRLAGVGAVRADVPDRDRDRPARPDPRPAVDERRRPRLAGGDADRRPRAPRPAVRTADAVHDVAQPAADRSPPGTTTPGSTSRSCRSWRDAGVQRFIAAAEVASEEYFNPVVPEEVAQRLRSVA